MIKNKINPEKYVIKRRAHSGHLGRNKTADVFKHMCIITTKRGHVISTGYNHIIPGLKTYSIHAEHDAVNNAVLYTKRMGIKKKKPMTVNAYVLRDNGMNSKPCFNCITEQLSNNPHFNFRKVYYSNTSTSILNDTDCGIELTKSTVNNLYENRYSHFSKANLDKRIRTGETIDSNVVNIDTRLYELEDEEDDEESNESNKPNLPYIYIKDVG
jgi:hypothetical protein